ncbi:putative cyclase-associated protein CAP/septum formation inhibitor MinC [Medicago truncatula]|uniref:TBCC domain-containing protein 1 n=1 Tax=Medicago truncatula TaxID=3880 RepID=A2Q4U5_MEDTR|nr:TBCC domain-containing protein 1 [Medicago truncatula]XP_039684056.1 TBCC domain-containing protein 1 [Medicago truncatula]ABN08645.1 Tubulin binding cofactor C [Medicago truncatula]AES81442.1 tubulin-binding cofactor C domain protein [Medicago truncatula]RHN47935.1 putative cyclase-associated protein CAP/septum formation inhibitor MinC [Medicago truncatula]
MTEPPPESAPSTPPPPPTSTTVIHPRREPFEHGLLPIPKLIFSDPAQTLISFKHKLLESSSNNRVGSVAISESLQISVEQAKLVLDTLASVLPSESDSESDSVDVNDLVLFLYVQSYKRLLPRTHKDSAAVADVWPSTSAFDGYLSALSPLQLVRSNSKRFTPSQADEEAHQLSYLQKHLANIVSLLAEPVEGESEESLVLTMDRFEHLGFLFQYGDKGSEGNSLSQSSPFFANSDPDMPAVPVPASQVHDWLLQNIASALEYIAERTSSKENGPVSVSDQDVAMTDASTVPVKVSTSARGASLIEGISKSSYAKHASDIKGSSVKVLNCHESAIYILAPLRYATIYGCSDATIVIGAVGKAVRVEHCERVHVIVAAKRICIANCRECVFFLGVNQQPLIVGDNHKLQVAPYNTFYSQLEQHMNEVGVLPSVNRWDEPIALGMVDPHDSLSHPAGVSDAQAESAARVDPDQFTNFVIPNWLEGESTGSTKDNPFTLPEGYMASQQRNERNLGEIRQLLREAPLEESRKRELSSALHVYFKDWLYASGNIRQLYYLQGD